MRNTTQTILNFILTRLRIARSRFSGPSPVDCDLRPNSHHRNATVAGGVVHLLEDDFGIPFREETEDDIDCRRAQLRGRHLARQERWDDLAADMMRADRAGERTRAGVPLADLYAFGARSDLVMAAEDALENGRPDGNAPILEGIRAFESIRDSSEPNPYIDLVVAMAHVDIGWAWRGNRWAASVPQTHRVKCAAHFQRAIDLLDTHFQDRLTSPALAAAQCALLAGRNDPSQRIVRDYETLFDLDPHNHRHLRAFGNQLLPRWFGSYQQLELAARKTAAQTRDTWGSGGYTWVCMDAIATDDQACANVDVEFFIDGVFDIVAADPGQEILNTLAAYCAVTQGERIGGDSETDLVRMQIAECARSLICDHLTEIHPVTWAQAAEGFDENLPGTSLKRFAARGREEARRVLADLLRDEPDLGLGFTFAPVGPGASPV